MLQRLINFSRTIRTNRSAFLTKEKERERERKSGY